MGKNNSNGEAELTARIGEFKSRIDEKLRGQEMATVVFRDLET
jgi:hypothetical protein